MLVLGVNTVGDVCAAALVKDDRILAESSEPMTQGHDARLAPIVEATMRLGGKGFDELARIAVIVGPGSFTGVRVGVAFARGLTLALDAPSVGVSSLEALEGLPRDKRVLGLLPAKRRPPERTWWAQVLEGGRGAAEPIEADENEIRRLAADAAVVCGQYEGAGIARPLQRSCPSASAAARFAARLGDADLPAPRPIYVREPDARPMGRP